MKKIAYLMLFTMVVFFSCKKDKTVQVHSVTVQLAYPATSSFKATEGVTVKITGKGTAFEAKTNAEGKATFSIPTDIYEISASDVKSNAGTAFVYNGLKSNVAVTDGWNANDVINLDLVESKTSQLVIKEVFIGGTIKDDNSGNFSYDGYIIIYNNSNYVANTTNLCIGAIGPTTAQSTNNFYVNDKLMYENENWIPLNTGFWYFQQGLTIEPGQQVVVALYNAVNNTLTHSRSINFDNKDYYVTYDIAGQFKHASYYVSPAASIPTSHYLKSVAFAASTAWTPGVITPGVFLFETKNTTPTAFGADATNITLSHKKVPTDWVIDGIEGFYLGNTGNKKRFLPSIDAGYVYHINRKEYSIYRNVDEAATKAIAGNEAKLKYGYSLGTVAQEANGGTTDPSGIDAEASIKNGARIIYKDTNNSTNDAHLRSKASLRNN